MTNATAAITGLIVMEMLLLLSAHKEFIEAEKLYRRVISIKYLKQAAKDDFYYFIEINSVMIFLYTFVFIWGLTGELNDNY